MIDHFCFAFSAEDFDKRWRKARAYKASVGAFLHRVRRRMEETGNADSRSMFDLPRVRAIESII